MKNKTPSVYQTAQITIYILLGVAAFLSIVQFLANRSLWLDEAYLALNILNRNHYELLVPLDDSQMAPIFFLQISKMFYSFSPNQEFGLRIFPLLCFGASIILFRKTLMGLPLHPVSAIFAFSLFIFNNRILYYSSEFKQYMTDVLIVVFFTVLLMHPFSLKKMKYIILTIAGCVAISLSYIAPIILLTSGAYLMYMNFRDNKGELRHLSIASMVWLINYAIYYILFNSGHPAKGHQVAYWENINAFLPYDVFSIEFLYILKGRMVELIVWSFSENRIIMVLFFILMLMGIISLIRNKTFGTLILLLIPASVNLLLSILKLYPFSGRMILYLVPYAILLAVFGFDAIFRFSSNYFKPLFQHLFILLLPVLIAITAVGDFPKENQEIKKSLDYIKSHISDEHSILINRYARKSFDYYAQTGYISTDLFDEIFRMEWSNDYVEQYREKISNLNGKYWLLFNFLRVDEDFHVIESLSEIGYEPLQWFRTKGSSAYLYNFSQNKGQESNNN